MELTIIIPTTCESERRKLLRRAILSVLKQRRCAPNVLLAVNGDRVDPKALDEFSSLPRVSVYRRPEPGLPEALFWARKLVRTEIFGYLDDDDEFLPGALEARLAVLRGAPQAAAVVSDGFGVDSLGRESLLIGDWSYIRRDPLVALLVRNWLASCGAVFRSAMVGPEFFADLPRYMEWTCVAFRLALERQLVFLEVPCFRVHSTPNSLSKDPESVRWALVAYDQMLSECRMRSVRRLILRKRGAALHALSDAARREGKLRAAFAYHLATLTTPGGLSYLTYTGRLLMSVFEKYRRQARV